MFSRLQFALLLSAGLMVLGCNRAAPPTALNTEADPANMNPTTAAITDAEKEITAKGAGNVSEETLRGTAGIAGGKSQPSGGN